MRVAASGVAELSPTPTPLRTAIVARVPVMEEQNACTVQEVIMRIKSFRSFILVKQEIYSYNNKLSPLDRTACVYLHCVPHLISQVVITDTVWIALR